MFLMILTYFLIKSKSKNQEIQIEETSKSAMNIEDLLGKGYFPKELPPPFNTKSLAAKYPTIKGSLSGTDRKTATRCVDFSIAKVGLVRKMIKIPNPMHQCDLCEVITDNWNDIEAIYQTSKFSCSRPKLIGDRAANPMKFKEFIRKTFLASYPYVYELKSDISKYYPTIYTHSIPWAIHGKAVSKIKPIDRTLLGNKLDPKVQQTMYGQTIGIPIGPDTSLIIAEIIGCTIDSLLSASIPNLKGYRYVDDMYFFFHTHAEAEEALLKLQQTLKAFELQINAEKTKIRKIPRGIEPDWIVQLRTFAIRDKEVTQYNDLISFFSLAFDLAIQLPNEYVLSYAVEKIKRINLLSDKNFALLETMLLKTMVAEPSTIKEIFRILYTYKDKVRVSKVKKVLLDYIKYNCPRGNDYELSWALWIAKSFSIKLPKDVAEILSKSSDCISILIVLDLVQAGLIEKSDLDTTEWESKLHAASLIDENWLLAYELGVKKWIGSSHTYIDAVPYFKILRSTGISFYDGTLQIDAIDLTKKETIEAEPETEYEKAAENKTTEITEDVVETPAKIEDIEYSFGGDEEEIEMDGSFDEEDILDVDYLNYM